jgi:hypothetical protein
MRILVTELCCRPNSKTATSKLMKISLNGVQQMIFLTFLLFCRPCTKGFHTIGDTENWADVSFSCQNF